jgi:hypothetical protein
MNDGAARADRIEFPLARGLRYFAIYSNLAAGYYTDGLTQSKDTYIMDINNKYETVHTHNLVRFEHSALLLVMAWIAFINYQDINWYLFNALFWGIDLLGFYPGILYYKYISKDVPKIFYAIYNISHSYLTWTVFSVIWFYFYGLDYVLLAPWMHLMADRGIFGNTLKAYHIAFNIEKDKNFAEFERTIYK